jgi:hypothetical protein
MITLTQDLDAIAPPWSLFVIHLVPSTSGGRKMKGFQITLAKNESIWESVISRILLHGVRQNLKE